MYKSTRHTNKSWTYAPESLGAYVAVREDQAAQLLRESEALLKKMSLQEPTDFVNHQPDSGPMAYTRFVNGWLRRGRAYLRKMGVPPAVIMETPNWLLLAPQLGKAIRRISYSLDKEIIPDLRCIHGFLLQRHAPLGPRPKFSSRAVRVSAVPQNEKRNPRVVPPRNPLSRESNSGKSTKTDDVKRAKLNETTDNTKERLNLANSPSKPIDAHRANERGRETAISAAMKKARLRP